MLKNLARGIATAALAATLAGCAIRYRPYESGMESSYITPELIGGTDVFYFKPVELPREFRTTPPHPDDPFLTGDTVTGNPKGFAGRVKAGAGLVAGLPNLRVIARAEAGYNYSEVFAREKQSSDTRERENSSFAQTRLEMRGITWMPVVGLEAILGPLTVRAEYGTPHTQFDVRSAWDRYRQTETYDRHSWRGQGQQATLSATYSTKIMSIGAFGGKEWYDAEFGGHKTNLDSFVGGLMIEFRK